MQHLLSTFQPLGLHGSLPGSTTLLAAKAKASMLPKPFLPQMGPLQAGVSKRGPLHSASRGVKRGAAVARQLPVPPKATRTAGVAAPEEPKTQLQPSEEEPPQAPPPTPEEPSFKEKVVVLFSDKDKLHWSKLPVLLGALWLDWKRSQMQKKNLFSVGPNPGGDFDPKDYPFRTDNGAFNTPGSSLAGSTGSFFGRNQPVDPAAPAYNPGGKSAVGQYPPVAIDDPPVQVVAQKLLTRDGPIKSAAPQFNVLAASWIQFMIHDWIDHEESLKDEPVVLSEPKASGCPLRKFQFYKTHVQNAGGGKIAAGTANQRSAWWDGSAVYGSTGEVGKQLRTFKGGKLHVTDKGDPITDPVTGAPVIGDVRNSWAGVTVLQTLFVNEHNLVCDEIAKAHPTYDDEKIYGTARLVISALIAKIHTIDWTTELLKNPTLKVGMNANWYGILGKWVKETFGHTGSPELSGLVGLKKPDVHGTPYSLTEDFTAVYRLHSLIPDNIELRDISKPDAPIVEEVWMNDIISPEGEAAFMAKAGTKGALVSFGAQPCGMLRLNNYPNPMRNVIPENPDGTPRTDTPIDLAAVDLYRDRERGVPRYNNFRRNLGLPPVTSWQALTQDKDEQRQLADVYGPDSDPANLEKLDLLVGMHAEKLLPGFAISETAFLIFLLMASRRLDSDRYFTSNYTEEFYTKEGLKWIEKTEGLKDVIARYDAGVHKFCKTNSAFSVWTSRDLPADPVPLYLQIPGIQWPWLPNPKAVLSEMPGPERLPILGNALSILKSKGQFHRQFVEWANEFGGVYYAKLGPGKDTVVVSDPVLFRELGKPLPQGLPKLAPLYEIMRNLTSPSGADSILPSTNYRYHKSLRSQLAPVFAPSQVPAGFEIAKEAVTELISKMKPKAGGSGALVDVADVCLRAALTMVGRLSWNIEVDVMDLSKPDPVLEAYKAARFREFAMTKNPLLKFFNQTHEANKKIIFNLYDKADAGLSKCPLGFGAEPATGQAEAIKGLKDWYTGNPLEDAERKANIGVLGLAGSFPASILAAYALYELAATPHILKQLEEELAAVGAQGSPENLTYADFSKLPMLEAVIKETVRLHPIAPLGNRVTDREMTLNGHIVPAGTGIMMLIAGVHCSVHNYLEPMRFIPERWLLSQDAVEIQHASAGTVYEGPVAFKKDPWYPNATPIGNINDLDGSFVPFSSGERECLGKNFAWMEVQTLVAMLVSAFKIEVGPNTGSPQQVIKDESFAITINPGKTLELRFTSR